MIGSVRVEKPVDVHNSYCIVAALLWRLILLEVMSKGRSGALVRLALAGLLVVILSLGPLAMSAYADSTYKVQPGDNLITIASRFGVSVDAIVAANALPSRSTIYTGQVLVIPSSGSNPAPPPRTGQTSYKVQSGDTLGGIAVRYGVTTDAIARANGL